MVEMRLLFIRLIVGFVLFGLGCSGSNRSIEVAPPNAVEREPRQAESPVGDERYQILAFLGIDPEPFLQQEPVTSEKRAPDSVENLNIWMLDISSADSEARLSQKTFDGGYLSPIMSRDGQEIWCVRNGAIYRMTADGSNLTRVFAQDEIVPRTLLDWERDNDSLLMFVTENYKICTLDVQTGQLIGEPYHDINPERKFIRHLIEWTRTKEKGLLYDTVYLTRWDILLQPKGSRYTQSVTDDVYTDRDPAWSPDGNSILFVSDRTQ